MPRFCPNLEALETRYAPAAPVISLTATAAGNAMVTLSGAVQDESPGHLMVMFCGAYSGSTQTNADGVFAITFTATRTGQVTAIVYDHESYYSQATALLENQRPIVELSAVNNGDNWWTLSGRVLDEAPEGLVVRLSGPPSINGQTVTVGADGTFSITVQMQEGESGYLTAWTADWWNQMAGTQLYLDNYA